MQAAEREVASPSLSAAEQDGEGQYRPAAATSSFLAPADFKPFFVLLEDPRTGEHHHPDVQYVFSDDDPELLTSATLAALPHDGSIGATDAANVAGEASDRLVLVDIDATGKEVTNATSLSPAWQALKAGVAPAPSWGHAGDASERGLVLKIAGFESAQGEENARETMKSLSSKQDVDVLLKAFDERLAVLDSAIGSPQTRDEVGP